VFTGARRNNLAVLAGVLSYTTGEAPFSLFTLFEEVGIKYSYCSIVRKFDRSCSEIDSHRHGPAQRQSMAGHLTKSKLLLLGNPKSLIDGCEAQL
jgi:hypothetical protein